MPEPRPVGIASLTALTRRIGFRVRTSAGLGGGLIGGVVLLLLVQLGQGDYSVQQVLLIGATFAVAATSWALFAGFGGQYSFGHAALFGLPAYGAYLVNEYWHVPPLLGVVGCAAVLSVASLLLVGPALRLRGPYFSLVMLAFAEIARRAVNAYPQLTGGEDGKLVAGEKEGLLYLEAIDVSSYVTWLFALLVIMLLVFWTFLRTRTGRELTAVRDDEDIAMSTGVRTTTVKMSAFVLSGFFIGIAGGIYAYSTHIVASDSLLGPDLSVAILIYAGIGGMRSLYGPAIGAFLLVALQERFRTL